MRQVILHIPVRLGFPHDEYHGSRELLPCDSAIFFPRWQNHKVVRYKA